MTTTTGRYVVKCDDCKTTIGHTDDVRESYAGGRCRDCADKLAAEVKLRGWTRIEA